MAPLVLKKKLLKVQAMRTDGPQMLEALDTLSEIYNAKGNDLEARRNLRGGIEERSLLLAEQFIREFEPAHSRIQLLTRSVDKMHEVCDALAFELDRTQQRTAAFTDESRTLVAKRKEITERAEVMDTFLRKFKLSETQLAALSEGPRDADGGATFFSTLEDVVRIRSECRALINSNFQSAGVELFETMAAFQEQAHEHLYGWVQGQCALIDSEFPEPSEALRKGITTLAEVPAYHNHVRECIADTRAIAVARRFTMALTVGDGSRGGTRPIEMHAHDPLRYVGDMLAWVHQRMAVEKNLVTNLFPDKDRTTQKQQQQEQESADEAKTTTMTTTTAAAAAAAAAAAGRGIENAKSNADTLNKIFAGIAPELSGRVRQVLDVSPPLVLSYKLYNLLEFYKNTLQELLGGDESGLGAVTLESLQKNASCLFFDTIQTQCNKLLTSPPAYPCDLSVALEVSELIRRLSEVLTVYKDALQTKSKHSITAAGGDGFDVSLPSSVFAEREARFAPVLKAFIEPLLKMCRTSASGLDRSDYAVYLINNLVAIQSSLTRFDFTASWVQQLTGEIGDWSDVLVKDQADKILRRSGMTDKIELASRALLPGTVLAAQPGMDLDSLKQALDGFYKSMFSLVVKEFDRLVSPRLRATARNQTSQTLAAAYDDFFNNLHNLETSGYTEEQLCKVFLHNPAQVRQLLDA